MNYHQPYWNPILETLPPEALRQLQLKKFQRIFHWAYTHSKFHRALYRSAGVAPEDIRALEDIRRVPTVEKSMMRQIQGKDPYPHGDALCVPLDDVTVFRQTSGTTGQPVYQPDTWHDWEWWAECWCYILWSQGYRPNDRVFIPFGYNVFVAFWAGHYAAEKLGCEVVGRSDDITKVKGVLLAPSAIEEVVRGIKGLGDEYEVVVDKTGDAETIRLRVEVLPEAQDQCTLIQSELQDQLRLKTNLRYDLEICGCGTLPRYEVKAKRFKDLRSKKTE